MLQLLLELLVRGSLCFQLRRQLRRLRLFGVKQLVLCIELKRGKTSIAEIHDASNLFLQRGAQLLRRFGEVLLSLRVMVCVGELLLELLVLLRTACDLSFQSGDLERSA